jgi:hypothetical protein
VISPFGREAPVRQLTAGDVLLLLNPEFRYSIKRAAQYEIPQYNLGTEPDETYGMDHEAPRQVPGS